MALKLKFGADPELFLMDRSTNQFVSAHDLLPGTKFEPFPVKSGAIQVDGVAAEFNIEPAYNSVGFVTNIHTVLGELQSKLGDKYRLCAVPAVHFPSEYFSKLPEEVRTLGCNPDFNAWTGQVNEKPDSSGMMRTAAGHIHIGWLDKHVDPTDDVHVDDCRIIAKQLDYYLGMYSLMWDPDQERRKLYGRAGAFRPKPYGMEYRPLSNVWLRSKALTQWVFDSSYKAVMDVIESGRLAEDEFGDKAQDIINSGEDWWSEMTSGKTKKGRDFHKFTQLQMPPKVPAFDPSGKKVMKVKAKYPFKYAANGHYYAGNGKSQFVNDIHGSVVRVEPSGLLIEQDTTIHPDHVNDFINFETEVNAII